MSRKLKYIRLKRYNEIIIFPEVIQHSTFEHLDVKSAGFCYVKSNTVECFGGSVSLKVTSDIDDSQIATDQLFGEEY